MSDEQNKNEPEKTPWVMPEPTFQSSEGFTPKSALAREAQNEPSEHDTEDALSEIEEVTAVKEPISVKPSKKKGGCASAAVSMLGVFVAVVLIVVLVLAYLLFWYQPQDTTTF